MLQVIKASARAAHEANRAWCILHGDMSQAPWENAESWQVESACFGVLRVMMGANADTLHASWVDEKKAAGWKWGPVKDADKKEHPCMVPFAQLPPEQRAKDDLFLTVIWAVLHAHRAVADSLLASGSIDQGLSDTRGVIVAAGLDLLRRIDREREVWKLHDDSTVEKLIRMGLAEVAEQRDHASIQAEDRIEGMPGLAVYISVDDPARPGRASASLWSKIRLTDKGTSIAQMSFVDAWNAVGESFEECHVG